MKRYNSLPILLIDLQLKQKKFKDFSFLTCFTISPSNIAQIKVQRLHVLSDELRDLFKLKFNYTYFLISLVMSKSNMVSHIAALPQCAKYPIQHSVPEKVLQHLFSTKLMQSCSHLSEGIFFYKNK